MNNEQKLQVATDALKDCRELHIGSLLKPMHFNAMTDIVDAALAILAAPSTEQPAAASAGEQAAHEAWYNDPNRKGSTFGYQNTREGILDAFKERSLEGWTARAEAGGHELKEALTELASVQRKLIGANAEIAAFNLNGMVVAKAAEKERDDLRARVEAVDAVLVEVTQERDAARAQLARPADLAGLTRYAQGGDPSRDGSYYLADDVQALLAKKPE